MGVFDFFNRKDIHRQQDRRVQELYDRASETSPIAKRILEQAVNNGIKISMMSGMDAVGTYDDAKRSIFLNPEMSDEILMTTLVHEARHSDQSVYYTSTNTIESAIKVNRAMEADAMAVQCAAAFEMRISDPAIFSEFKGKHPLIAKAYEAEIKSSKDTQKALSSAFKAWYSDEKYVDSYDHDVACFMKKHYSPSRSLRSVSDRDLVMNLCPYMRNDKDFFASKEANTMNREVYDAARKIETDKMPSSRKVKRTSLDTMYVKESDGKVTPPLDRSYPQMQRMTVQNMAARLGRLSSR